jgi:hypothetical protein
MIGNGADVGDSGRALGSHLVLCHVGPLFEERPRPVLLHIRILHIYYTNSKYIIYYTYQ